MPEFNFDPAKHTSKTSDVPAQAPKQTPQPRTKPMAVLCLGLSRTGTMSLFHALQHLGYNAYHAAEMARQEANDHPRLWREAIEAKYYGQEGRYKRLLTGEDFDRILWDYQTTADTPTVLFADELLAAYPDAKVILTERDPDSWLKSAESIIYHILGLKIWRVLEVIDTGLARHYIPIIRYSVDIWTHGDMWNRVALRRGYLEHNQHIKDVVPKKRLLVFHPRDGWEPLCKHLGKPIPDVPFPKINVGNGAALAHEGVFARLRFEVVAKKAAKVVVPVGVVLVAIWAYGRWARLK